MLIKLNKKEKNIPKNSTLKDLTSLLGLNTDGIIIEVNLNIIQKEKWKDFILQDSNLVEIITFIGGG